MVDGARRVYRLAGEGPAYFADCRKTVEQTGRGLHLRVAYGPNRLPAPWGVRDRFGAIKVPTPVIVGTYDFICPPAFAHGTHAGIPDAQLPELRESGHFGHIEQPDDFAAIVSDFVTNQEMGRQA